MAKISNSNRYFARESIPDSCAILSVAQTYAADKAAINMGISSVDLMESAGVAIAKLVQEKWPPRRVVVLCGPGNNGGDGFVVARRLAEAGWDVSVLLNVDINQVRGDAAINMERWLCGGFPILQLDIDVMLDQPLVIDCLYGTGLSRPLEGPTKEIVDYINQESLTCVAADIPSGVNGDSGKVLGTAPRCTNTVTFFRPKPGHLLYPGRDLCGLLNVVDIGIPSSVLSSIIPNIASSEPELWTRPVPGWHDHKYRRGHAIIVGGGQVTGASRLASRAARRSGAGLVTLAVPPDSLPIYAVSEPGAFVMPIYCDEDFSKLLSDCRQNGILIGPGCGVGGETAERVLQILGTNKAVVLDADALTSFEDDRDQLFEAIHRRTAPVVLTPHGGEFTLLFGEGGDKLSRATEAARLSGAVVVFKGADTVVSSPNGQAAINSNAPPWLATAGSGDVLAGMILGLLVQGMSPWKGAVAAAWLHGAAGAEAGEGLIAEDLPEILPKVLEIL